MLISGFHGHMVAYDENQHGEVSPAMCARVEIVLWIEEEKIL